MKIYFRILLLLSIAILYSHQVDAQVAITAVPFLEINNHARSMGLAGSTVAYRGLKSGLHLNPATIGNEHSVEFSSQFNTKESFGLLGTPWLTSFSSDLQIYQPSFIIGFKDFSIGYQYTYFNLGSQFITEPFGTEFFKSSNSYEFAHTISVSTNINKHLSIGFGFNSFKSRLESLHSISGREVNSASGNSLDFGAYFEYPFIYQSVKIKPSLGWSLTDFGNPIRYSGDIYEDPLPMTMSGGFGLTFDIDEQYLGLQIISVGVYGSLDKILARKEEVTRIDNGITLISYEAVGPLEALFQSWGRYERFNGAETITLNVWEQFRRQSGLEVTLIEIISLRFGKYYEHPENGARNYRTFGIGLSYKYFSFDYSTIDNNKGNSPIDNTDFYELSIKIPFGIFSK